VFSSIFGVHSEGAFIDSMIRLLRHHTLLGSPLTLVSILKGPPAIFVLPLCLLCILKLRPARVLLSPLTLVCILKGHSDVGLRFHILLALASVYVDATIAFFEA